MSASSGRLKSAKSGLEQRSDVVAVFDLDGTLMRSTIIESYLWLRLADRDIAGAANLERDDGNWRTGPRRSRLLSCRAYTGVKHGSTRRRKPVYPPVGRMCLAFRLAEPEVSSLK